MDTTGKILDFCDDLELFKQAKDEGVLPEFMEEEITPDITSLPDSAFAHVDYSTPRPTRKYATNTRGQTWLSTLYFLKYGHVLPQAQQTKVAGRLQKRCELFQLQLPELLDKVASSQEFLQAEVLCKHGEVTLDKFALVREDGTAWGPLFTPEHVKQAVDYFNEHWRFLDHGDRRKIAQNIVRRFDELLKEGYYGREPNTPLFKTINSSSRRGDLEDSNLFKSVNSQSRIGMGHGLKAGEDKTAAGFKGVGEGLVSKIKPELSMSAPKVPAASTAAAPKTPGATPKSVTAAELPPITERLMNYAGECWNEKLGAAIHDRIIHGAPEDTLLEIFHNRGTLGQEKVAALLDTLDRRMGLDRLWDKSIPDPTSSVYSFNKEALMDTAIWDNAGLRVTETMLNDLAQNPSKIAGLYDQGFAREFAEDPRAVFDSLPNDDKQAIAELAAEGQTPDEYEYREQLTPGLT